LKALQNEKKKDADIATLHICFCNKEHWSIYNWGKTKTDVTPRTTSVWICPEMLF
jgi:hypothetical protein